MQMVNVQLEVNEAEAERLTLLSGEHFIVVRFLSERDTKLTLFLPGNDAACAQAARVLAARLEQAAREIDEALAANADGAEIPPVKSTPEAEPAASLANA